MHSNLQVTCFIYDNHTVTQDITFFYIFSNILPVCVIFLDNCGFVFFHFILITLDFNFPYIFIFFELCN